MLNESWNLARVQRASVHQHKQVVDLRIHWSSEHGREETQQHP
ncbi:MAG TPA: hypothetical protein VGE69_07375 [Pseudomonadales bacterium]